MTASTRAETTPADARAGGWRRLSEHSLGLVFGILFLLALAGQALAGHAAFNAEQTGDGLPPVSLARYLTSASFAADVAENWQSEYLQFFLYIVLRAARGRVHGHSVDLPAAARLPGVQARRRSAPLDRHRGMTPHD